MGLFYYELFKIRTIFDKNIQDMCNNTYLEYFINEYMNRMYIKLNRSFFMQRKYTQILSLLGIFSKLNAPDEHVPNNIVRLNIDVLNNINASDRRGGRFFKKLKSQLWRLE